MVAISKIVFDENTIVSSLEIDFDYQEIYIDKSNIGKDDNEKLNYNFLAVGRKSNEAKKLIADLANHGFFLTHHKNGVSLFKKFIDDELFLSNFNDVSVKVWNSIFYILEDPKQFSSENKLLIIFSSISDLPFNASVSRRMFFKNLPNVADRIPKNAYILRIADFGGVLGSAYLNTKANPNIEDNIQSLIKKIQIEKSIKDDNVVLYGSGKGATGAIYYGITMGLKTISLDPVLSDEYYIKNYNDMYFVNNIFDKYKQEVFHKLFDEHKNNSLNHITLVSSSNSEQMKYIAEMVFLPNLSVNKVIFNSPEIKKSSDIELVAENLIFTLLNMLLFGLNDCQKLVTIYQ